MPGQGVRAAIYTRMSLASMGDTTKVDDQERRCRDVADWRGWEIADVYCDNNRSAWQRNRKRPGWDRMLADIEAGRVGAIIVYHGDRLIRQPWDLELLINLAYGKGIKLASPTGDKDLSNPDDLYILRIEAAGQCRESDRTSQRRKAQYERWRREGRVRPGGRGGRPFGFATDGVTHVEAECDVIREMARRVLAGESAGVIVRGVSARGVRTPTGAEFSHATLRKMLARPRLAGLMPDGESKAAWEPVLDRETWERVRAALDARAAGFGYATNARRWLLSGIARCGAALDGGSECGSPMRLNPSKGKSGGHVNGYQCTRKGCSTYRSAEHLDAYVSAAVVAHLADERNPAASGPEDEGQAAEWGRLHRQRAETEELLADPEGGSGKILMRRLATIDARIGELRQLADTSQRDRLVSQYRGITLAEFRALPLDVRRALVAATVTVVVLPASRRGPGFRPQDVRVAPVQ